MSTKITTIRQGLLFFGAIKLGFALALMFLIDGSFETLWAQIPSTSEKVRIAVPGKSLTYLPLFLGKEQGLFRDQGIDLELIMIPGPIAAAALQAGEIDYTAAPNIAMRAAIRGAPVRPVMFFQIRLGFSLIGQPGMTPDKLNTIAVNGVGTATHYAALATMDKLGQGGRKILYIGTASTTMSYQALINKTVDAAIITPPFISMATTSGYVYLGDSFHIPGVLGGLGATMRHLTEKRKQTKRVIYATLRAIDRIASNREEVIDYIKKEYHVEHKIALESYDIMKRTFNPSGDIDDNDLKQIVEQVKKEIGVTADIPLDRVADLSILREVQAELKKKKSDRGKYKGETFNLEKGA
jgi:ABC-type nitrate/sulfonate/bicarbonate transport system substrate-binding protein